MAEKSSRTEAKARWLGIIIGAVLTVLAGLILLQRAGDGLARSSYDLLFIRSPDQLRKQVPEELIMVYLDGSVKRNLGQPADQPLDRHFYTLLLDRLTQDNARLVLFDILFDEPHPDPAVDLQFAEAIRKNGRVVLVGGYERAVQANFQMDMPVPPTAVLSSVAKWGLAKCDIDPDYSIRRLVVGGQDDPAVGWIAASMLGASATNQLQSRLAENWLNYYCPPDRLRSVNLDVALATNGLPDGYFRDKIVVIGARPSAGVAGDKREIFRSPYSLIGLPDATGPAVQAFNLLNLVRGDWMTRLTLVQEKVLVVVWGIFIAAILMALRPGFATIIAIVCFVAVGLAATYCQIKFQLWFCWLIPAAVQTSIALVWGVGYRFVVADRRRRQLRRAFGSYLSPFMADQIANSEFDLALGGKEIEASVMFTDLEGFTKMSENLPPSEVSKILVAYFNHTTRAILEQDGTIIKYVGDAVMAVWGAPLPEKRHAQRAVLAAWGMSQAGMTKIEGRFLRTRIGVNTGIVLSGNLGSEFRFDYTCIGDTTNFAARLEGLNKQLGTDVLISEFTAQQLDGSIKLRPLGRFIAVGKKKAIGIFEVLGLVKDFPQDPLWVTEFARALEHYQRQELDAAEKCFQAASAQRVGADGPSEFYLKEIAAARQQPSAAEWTGDVVLHSK
jgi:adenylate cyclase